MPCPFGSTHASKSLYKSEKPTEVVDIRRLKSCLPSRRYALLVCSNIELPKYSGYYDCFSHLFLPTLAFYFALQDQMRVFNCWMLVLLSCNPKFTLIVYFHFTSFKFEIHHEIRKQGPIKAVIRKEAHEATSIGETIIFLFLESCKQTKVLFLKLKKKILHLRVYCKRAWFLTFNCMPMLFILYIFLRKKCI